MITFTLNCKCNVEETLAKYRQYLKGLLDEFELNPKDVWADDPAAQLQLRAQWSMVHPAGVDRDGRQIMWLSGGGADLEVPDRHIRACCRYFYAVHADLETLRRGVTLVIDTSSKTAGQARKLQAVWQKNLPLRPQHIYILGTNAFTRPIINAAITIASVFLKKKVISRIKHVDLTALKHILGPAALPLSYGGEKRLPADQWIRERLSTFPLMHLPEPPGAKNVANRNLSVSLGSNAVSSAGQAGLTEPSAGSGGKDTSDASLAKADQPKMEVDV